MDIEKEELRKENKELKEMLSWALEKIKELESKIIQLEKEKIPSFVKPDNNHRHKKTGQKNGHKGYSRRIPERID